MNQKLVLRCNCVGRGIHAAILEFHNLRFVKDTCHRGTRWARKQFTGHANLRVLTGFGTQTTSVPDDNYFLEGKGSALYKADSLQTKVSSQPASLKGEQAGFDFGEEGDKLVEIVTDPMQFNSTKEAGNADGNVFWGKDFLLVNIDDGDQPVSIDIRPGKYNAVQLANEVERAINEAYGDDKKIQIVQNVDDTRISRYYMAV